MASVADCCSLSSGVTREWVCPLCCSWSTILLSPLVVCGALISDGTRATLVTMTQWLPPGASIDQAAALFKECASPEMHANYAVFLCSRVCELIADRTAF